MKTPMANILILTLILQHTSCSPSPQHGPSTETSLSPPQLPSLDGWVNEKVRAAAFQDAIKQLRALPASLVPRRVTPDPFAEYRAADCFARKYGTDAIEFLKHQTGHEDKFTQRFAMLALGALGFDEKASDHLKYLACQKSLDGTAQSALLAISLLPVQKARTLAVGFVIQPLPLETRILALRMLKGLGNAKTLDYLKGLGRKNFPREFNEALGEVIDSLDYRLNPLQTEQDRRTWARQELLYWQAPRPPFRHPDGGNFHAAKTLFQNREYLHPDFLERYLHSGDTTAAHLLGMQTAAYLLGTQKEHESIRVLKQYCAASNFRGGACRGALGRIGTSEALRTLEELLRPKGDRGVNADAAWILGNAGDKASLAILRSLSKDKQFDERSRQRFARAAETLEKRLVKAGN